MTIHALQTPRFLRKTSLAANERNINFEMIDRDIITVVSSEEADRVTPLMSKIYLRLRSAPEDLFERPGVLRFVGEDGEGKHITAWRQICRHLAVSSETANKALKWLHKMGVIGYSAHKNGYGIRIFLNRAARSIKIVGHDSTTPRSSDNGTKSHRQQEREKPGGEKNLPETDASDNHENTSVNETAFNENFVHREIRDVDVIPREPRARQIGSFDPVPNTSASSVGGVCADATDESPRAVKPAPSDLGEVKNFVEEKFRRTIAEIMELIRRERENDRRWFINSALPKATRIAVCEALKIDKRDKRADGYGLAVGKSAPLASDDLATHREIEPIRLTEADINGFVSYLMGCQQNGQRIEEFLSQMSSDNGGAYKASDVLSLRREVERELAKTSLNSLHNNIENEYRQVLAVKAKEYFERLDDASRGEVIKKGGEYLQKINPGMRWSPSWLEHNETELAITYIEKTVPLLSFEEFCLGHSQKKVIR